MVYIHSGATKIRDIAGEQFGSLDDIGMLEVAKTSHLMNQKGRL